MTEPSVLDLKLEHVFDVRIDFFQRFLFGPIYGDTKHGYTSVKSGTVSGPRLNGKVMDYSGADWPVVRGDGIVEPNAHYILQADDGTPIYIRNMRIYLRTERRPPRILPLHAIFPCAGRPARVAQPHRDRRRRRAPHQP